MWICIFGRHIEDFEMLGTGSVTSWGGWCSGQRWHWLWSLLWSRLWSQLSMSIGRRCTCSFASQACLQIFCGANWVRKVSGRVVLTKHSWLSFYHSLRLCMPRRLNTSLLLFLDLGARFLVQILHFLYCGARKSFLGHFGHIHGHAHVGLFQLYTTSLPCHCSRHVEHLQGIRCCLKQ